MGKLKFANKKTIIVLCTSIVFLSIAWIALFNYAARNLTIKIEQTMMDLKNKGYIFSYKKINLSGNPLQAKLQIDSPYLTAHQHGYGWQGDKIIVSAYLWDLKSIYATLVGKHVITTSLIPFLNPAIFHLHKGKINLKFNQQSKLADVHLQLPEVYPFESPSAQQNVIKNVSIAFTHLDKPFLYKLKASIEITGFEALIGSSLASHPIRLTTEIEMGGLQDGKPIPHTYAQWRDAGGVLDVNSLVLDWSPILLSANGTLTLDQSMRLLASFAAEIHGYEDALKVLVATGKMKAKHAKRASFILQLFSSTDKNGNHYIKIPITLQNGMLSTGPVNLLKLPSLEDRVIN